MSLRELGDGGLAVSRIGLGGNNFGRVVDLAGTRAIVDAAIDAGTTFIDTAERYGDGDSERFLGEALKGRRDRVVLATKFGGGPPGEEARGAPEYIRRAVEGSLRRLQTDYVDLLYYHAPDGITPIVETLAALDELVRQGTVRAIGCSNFTAAQLAEADGAARSTPAPLASPRFRTSTRCSNGTPTRTCSRSAASSASASWRTSRWPAAS